MAEYIVAIDQSTRDTRCAVFNHSGDMQSEYALVHRQIRPEKGWLEHDPMEIWANTQAVVRQALDKASITASDIVAVGIANQRETTVVWNRYTGRPYYNAVVWRDIRTADVCNQLARDGGQDRFRSQVGLPLATYFSGPKLKWLLDNVDGLRAAAQKGNAVFGNMDAWLMWNLTGGPGGGVHLTDVTNASRTMLMNLDTIKWNDEICEIMTVPKSMLPEIRPSGDPEVYGYTRPDGPFGGRVALCGVLGSQQAAAVGQVCLNPGEVKNSYDGASFMIMNTGGEIIPSEHGLLTTICYKFGRHPAMYALEGTIAFTGLLVEWLRDNLGIIDDDSDIEALARTVDDNGGIYFVPAFKGLFAPYWRSDARGVVVGLTRSVNKGHLARAALEAIAYQTRDVLEAMNADLGLELIELKADGHLTHNELLMQFQADLLGVPVIRPKVTEPTALGAAYAAGLAVGFWKDANEVRKHWSVDKVWQPDLSSKARTELYKEWKRAVTYTFGWSRG
jgi:glycerol kinase